MSFLSPNKKHWVDTSVPAIDVDSFFFIYSDFCCFILPSVLWHCWLGVRMSVQPGPHAKTLHIALDRLPHRHPITQFLQAGCSSWRPANSMKALKVPLNWFHCPPCIDWNWLFSRSMEWRGLDAVCATLVSGRMIISITECVRLNNIEKY